MPLTVESKQGSYPIHIYKSHFNKHFKKLFRQHPQSQFGIITDTNIYHCYRKTLIPLLKQSPQIHLLTIPAGEKSKQIRTKINLEKELFTRGFDRSSVLIAWGGGVIGDLVGFLAATYMRGISYYAFPTSVIAMVDSSIGGKTGIDTPYGKNLIGSLYPPKGVFIDVGFLATLPKREFINGCAEIAKYYFIKSQVIKDIIINTQKELHPSQNSLMIKLIEESLKVKIEVVNKDESESGLRRTLNFGHTFGHALEHLSHYRIPHGFAIAIGMGVEAFWALKKKSINLKRYQEIHAFLAQLKLPTYLPHAYNTVSAYQKLFNICLHDKKSQNNNVYFVCLQNRQRNSKKWTVKSNRGQFREPITKKEFMAFLKIYNRSIGTTANRN